MYRLFNYNLNKEYILEGIFPFKVDRDEFIQCYEEYFNSINGIDQKFLDRVKQADVKSMYLPYSFANSFYRKQHVREFNKLLEEIIPFNFKELKKMNPIYLDNSLAEIMDELSIMKNLYNSNFSLQKEQIDNLNKKIHIESSFIVLATGLTSYRKKHQ